MESQSGEPRQRQRFREGCKEAGAGEEQGYGENCNEELFAKDCQNYVLKGERTKKKKVREGIEAPQKGGTIQNQSIATARDESY